MKDLFSIQAAEYAKYRPSYPEELFEYICSFVPSREMAWDCATGNGQAAIHLAKYFDNVVASDISTSQLAHAPSVFNIKYIACPAENTPFAPHTFDLITVSQAYHWLDLEAFRKEVIRVGKQNAVIAVWMYDLLKSNRKDLNDLIQYFYNGIVGPFWDAERKFIEEHYETIPFNYEPLPSREFFIHKQFTLEDLLGFFSSWSASQKYLQVNGQPATDMIKDELVGLWPRNEMLTFTYPVYLKIGRIT